MTLTWCCTRCVRQELTGARVKRLTEALGARGRSWCWRHPSKKREPGTRNRKRTDVLEVTNVTVCRCRLRSLGVKPAATARGSDQSQARPQAQAGHAPTASVGQPQRGDQQQSVHSFVQGRAVFSEETNHSTGDGWPRRFPRHLFLLQGQLRHPKLRRSRRGDLRSLMGSRPGKPRVSTWIAAANDTWLICLCQTQPSLRCAWCGQCWTPGLIYLLCRSSSCASCRRVFQDCRHAAKGGYAPCSTGG